jgi:hypothetical protein
MAFLPPSPLHSLFVPPFHTAVCSPSRRVLRPKSPPATPVVRTIYAVFKFRLRKKRPRGAPVVEPDKSGRESRRGPRGTESAEDREKTEDSGSAAAAAANATISAAPRRIVHQVRSLVSAGQHLRIVGASCGGRVGAVLTGARERAVQQMLVLAPTRESCARAAAEARIAYPSARVVRDGGNGDIESDTNPVRTAKRAARCVVVGTPRAVEWSFKKHDDGPAWLASVQLLVLYDVQLLRDSGCFRELRKLVRAVLLNSPQVVAIFNSPDPDALSMLSPAVLPQQQVILWMEDTPRIVRDIAGIPSKYTLVHPKIGVTRILRFLIDEAMQANEGPCKVLVYFPTGRIAQMYAGFCNSLGVSVLEVHGNKTARHRARAMATFRDDERSILFSSDMASRGSELNSVTHIFHVGIPRDRGIYEQRLAIGGANVSNTVILQKYEVDAFLSNEMGEVTQHVPRSVALDGSEGDEDVTPNSFSRDDEFVNGVEMKVIRAAYFSWLAYYMAKSALLSWSKEDLVRYAASWTKLEIGLHEPPLFQRSTAKHLHLLGVDGVVIQPEEIPRPKRVVRRQGKRNKKGRARIAAESARLRAQLFARKAAQSASSE